MISKCRRVILGVVLASTAFIEADAKVTEAERGPIKSLMHTFESEMEKLRPYLVSDAAFEDPAARPKVEAALKTLEKQVNRAKPKGIDKNPGFRITYDLMAHHIRQTKRAFDSGKLPYARMRLNATANFCMSCHTQTPEQKNAFIGPWGNSADLKAATVVNSEYLFITRRFDQALARMDELIRKYPKSDLKAEQFLDVYRRKLAIFARVQRDPKAAVASFKADLGNKALPADIRKRVESWIADFEAWGKEKEDPSAMTDEKLMAFVKKALPEERLRQSAVAAPEIVKALRLSGLLYERLLNSPDPALAQEFLFYLAGIERQLAPFYWYSLSDSYLRECITKYPKRPYTKKCYDAFETDLRQRYQGQGKTDDDVQAQLERLKSHL